MDLFFHAPPNKKRKKKIWVAICKTSSLFISIPQPHFYIQWTCIHWEVRSQIACKASKEENGYRWSLAGLGAKTIKWYRHTRPLCKHLYS